MAQDLRALQKTLLVILKEVDRICRKNDIRYTLAFGTLLGAVRHKGFIPWDDDIDVGMLRPEYERFLRACERDLDREHFALQSWDTEPCYAFSFSKIRLKGTFFDECEMRRLSMKECGLFVDIFPYDSAAEEGFFLKAECAALNLMNRLSLRREGFCVWYESSGKWKDLMKKAADAVIFRIPRGLIRRLYRTLLWLINLGGSSRAVSANDMYSSYMRNYMPRALFDRMAEYEFEGCRFQGVADSDLYLRLNYGPDYMTLPPEDQRIWHNSGFDLGPYEKDAAV